MRSLLHRIEWALAQKLDALVERLDRRLQRRPEWDSTTYTFRAPQGVWEIEGDTRRLDFGNGFGLVFERKESDNG